jgi:hypothetical protein
MLMPFLAPRAYSKHREILLLASDIIGVLGMTYTKKTLDVALLRQVYSPRQIMLVPMLRQAFIPLRPLAAVLRWAMLCPFMLSHSLCTSSMICPSADWAAAHPVAAAVWYNVLLLGGSLVLALLTDLAARRAFVRMVCYRTNRSGQ